MQQWWNWISLKQNAVTPLCLVCISQLTPSVRSESLLLASGCFFFFTWMWIYHQHHQTLLVSISPHTKINFDLLCLIRGSLGDKLSLKLSLPAHIYSGSSWRVVFIWFYISVYDSAGAAQFTSLPVEITPTLSFISILWKGTFPLTLLSAQD